MKNFISFLVCSVAAVSLFAQGGVVGSNKKAVDCTTVTNGDECRFAQYNFGSSQGLGGIILKEIPSGLNIPSVTELGESDADETGSKVTAVWGQTGSTFGYVVEAWYANSKAQTASRYMLKFNSKKKYIEKLTIKEKQKFCDYPYFKMVPTVCQAKLGVDKLKDSSKYAGIYKQVEGSQEYSEGDKILVKPLLGLPSALLLTLFAGQFAEINVVVNYNAKSKEFQFSSGFIGDCEDSDCKGIKSISGKFVTMQDKRQYIVISANIHKGEKKTETWTYRAD